MKVVRLPDPDEQGRVYLDLWDLVKGARTKEEYLSACKGAVASIYASWKTDFEEWSETFAFARGPSPVLLVVTSDATRAAWIFEHLTKDYELLRNPDNDDRTRWVTIQVDSKVFDADRGNEAVLREMVNTVGRKGKPGERVRCIVSVNMLSEGWDVQSVTHILGLRAFGSPLLTEQIIGRGLRRTNYDVLNQPLEERPEGSEETERDLEAAIIRNLEQFLTELGSDFCFIGRQFAMRIDDDDYFLDLLFYHRALRCLVAIDLKIGPFTAADKGQMDLYLSWLKQHDWRESENEPVGLILCTSKKRQHVELLLGHGPHKMQVSEYLTKLPPKRLLEDRLKLYSRMLAAEGKL